MDKVSKNLIRGRRIHTAVWLYRMTLLKMSVCYRAGGKRWMVSPAAWVINWPISRFLTTPIYETERVVCEREIIKKINGAKGSKQREQGEPIPPAIFDESDTDH